MSRLLLSLVLAAGFAGPLHAQIPPQLQPSAQMAASNGDANDQFGIAVAIDGVTAVVGASGARTAYIFAEDQGGAGQWGQVVELDPEELSGPGIFGGAVAISGDTVVVGAQTASGPPTSVGAVYLFKKDQGGPANWGRVVKLTADVPQVFGLFGAAVALDGDTLVVGAPGQNSVYVFRRHQGGPEAWGQVAVIDADPATGSARFGGSLALDGDRILVGAQRDSLDAEDSGAAYLFDRNLGGPESWGQVARLTADVPADFAEFGDEVALQGTTAVVTATRQDFGRVFIFEENQGGADAWGLAYQIEPVDTSAFDFFGQRLALDGDLLVASALNDSSEGNS
ncbi:MAG: hypothetical protein AAFY88_26100, partial [Acidobacteriota bacterium]